MGQEEEKAARLKSFAGYQVDNKVFLFKLLALTFCMDTSVALWAHGFCTLITGILVHILITSSK